MKKSSCPKAIFKRSMQGKTYRKEDKPWTKTNYKMLLEPPVQSAVAVTLRALAISDLDQKLFLFWSFLTNKD